MKTKLLALGFQYADQFKDFSDNIKNVDYLYRVLDGRYQYVCLVNYDGKFVEAVLEEYLAVKNTRRPKAPLKMEELQARGFYPTRITLGRSWQDVESFINYVQ